MLTNWFGQTNGFRVTVGWMLRIALGVTLFLIPFVAYISA